MTLVKSFSLLAALALSVLACTALPSFAAPVVWQLRDIKFNDGGSASGSFTYDATIGKVLDWSIVATGHGADTFRAPIDIPFVNVPGCTGPACDTAQRFFKPLPAQDDFVFTHGVTPGSGGSLNLFSARPLTDERGIVSLTTGTDLGGSSLSCCETGVP